MERSALSDDFLCGGSSAAKVCGVQSLTPDVAARIAMVTRIDAEYWLRLEDAYQLDRLVLARQKAAEEEMMSRKEWIGRQPVTELIQRDYLPCDMRRRSLEEQERLLFNFYRVSSRKAYEEIYTEYKVAARTVKGTPSTTEALKAWLQIVTNEAEKVNATMAAEYNSQAFAAVLPRIASLSAQMDAGSLTFREYLLQIKVLCEKVGVILLYIEKLKDVRRLNGVALWLTKSRPIIALTLYGGAADKILFSFFHEAAHILHDNQKLIYVSDPDAPQEKSANNFAAEAILPGVADHDIRSSNGLVEDLKAIARKSRVSVDFVIGRYHYLTGQFSKPFHRFNSISWKSIGTWQLVG